MGLTPSNNKKRQEELIESIIIFVYEYLCKWRDNIGRPNTESEKQLNPDLLKFLSVCVRNTEFPFNFSHEEPQGNRRTVDIAVYPNNNECYNEVITVFECKRLSIDTGEKRKDEYVTGHENISGGIQRFKIEAHGEKHRIVGMIGYIQTGTCLDWQKTINNCIDGLCDKQDKDGLYWNKHENLKTIEYDEKRNKYHGKSIHPRKTKPDITIHHLWVNTQRHNFT
ncbi:MAG: hypothetical protein LBH43_02530 [Treponema sp.]|jgi:hypothetical protein|nr:hypothetical protein [Treponema sp.]